LGTLAQDTPTDLLRSHNTFVIGKPGPQRRFDYRFGQSQVALSAAHYCSSQPVQALDDLDEENAPGS